MKLVKDKQPMTR